METQSTPGGVPAEGRPVIAAPARRRRRWVTVLYGLLIFFCGGVVGSGVTLGVARRAIVKATQDPDWLSERAATRIKRQLKLSDEQTRKVEAILARKYRRLLEIRRITYPRVVEGLKEMEDEVAVELNPEQERKWRDRFGRLMSALPAPPGEAPEP